MSTNNLFMSVFPADIYKTSDWTKWYSIPSLPGEDGSGFAKSDGSGGGREERMQCTCTSHPSDSIGQVHAAQMTTEVRYCAANNSAHSCTKRMRKSTIPSSFPSNPSARGGATGQNSTNCALQACVKNKSAKPKAKSYNKDEYTTSNIVNETRLANDLPLRVVCRHRGYLSRRFADDDVSYVRMFTGFCRCRDLGLLRVCRRCVTGSPAMNTSEANRNTSLAYRSMMEPSRETRVDIDPH